MNWKENPRVASHWEFNAEKEKVVCNLCPRHCETSAGQMGFCLVRGNIDNTFHTYNFGKSVVATIECIETEAVNHYAPGAKILSLGNIGCMMACSYCQNWQTSQIKHLDDKNVAFYTPEEVIHLAKANGISVISWTYNDPVVWHEFVLETSRLAKKEGIITLYKSALYIEIEPLRELIEVIDIFSISLKSMNEEIYRKYTKGRLKPVLAAIKEIAKSDRHLEISQLVVTGLNDDGTDARDTARWVVENCGKDTPFHLVAYHPAFRYEKPRTTVETLLRLRAIAIEEGIQHCYLGNIYSENVSNTYCKKCSHKQVERFGLTVNITGIDEHGNCTNCGEKSVIKHAGKYRKDHSPFTNDDFSSKQSYQYTWNKEVNSLHIQTAEKTSRVRFKITRLPADKTEFVELNEGLERIILSRSLGEEKEISIEVDTDDEILYLPVLDRAHFPVVDDHSKPKKYLN